MGKVYIGTSGWHYKHWVGVFYPNGTTGSKMFEYYSRSFDTVELNNSFYHLPSLKTFETWKESSPAKFRFSVKASRFITHMKKLKEPKRSTEKFFFATDRLGNKLGPILFQLPPKWKLNISRLLDFLTALPKEHRYVFEFRNPDWLVPEVLELLRKHNVALCIHDFGEMNIPHVITADFTYIRFHGPTSTKYAGSYSSGELRRWSSRIDGWREKLNVYAYFNNDPEGAAPKNATTLKKLVGGD